MVSVIRNGGHRALALLTLCLLTANIWGVEGRFGSSQSHVERVEADWLRQESILNLPDPRTAVTEAGSADGGKKLVSPGTDDCYPVEKIVERGFKLVRDLRDLGVDVSEAHERLDGIDTIMRGAESPLSTSRREKLYKEARWAVRKLALSNPLLDFDEMLFVKRVPGQFAHMSDQYYGWWSRPGGGLYVLEGFKQDTPRVRSLTDFFPEGSFLRPDIAPDGQRILFAYCRYYAHVAGLEDKVTKTNIPEDAFYHVFEMNRDGSGIRQLTHGRYDDFDARYLPNGEIVFLSTRRGQFVQCGQSTAMATKKDEALGDSFVRCGGDSRRPVAVYTLHVMDSEGRTIRAISPFENFEWTPSIAHDGRILYARWDYVDRDNMPYMSLWSTNPDGTQPSMVYGNFTRVPHAVFEARSIPGSEKLIFTANAHHTITGGSLVLLDPRRGFDGEEPLTRLTPEVCFPESEAQPHSYYANPYPLSESYYLTAWSDVPIVINPTGGADPDPPNAMGLYLFDVYGNLELLYRDDEITSMNPLPIRPRVKSPEVAERVEWLGAQEGTILVQNVYEGLKGVSSGAVKRLRIVGMPAKAQPNMNAPLMGVTRDDPGKFVLGTVPVEEDGSAYFHAPSGVGLFFQALDEEGCAIQTMRSLTYIQAGQSVGCVGCHESRNTAPPASRPLAAMRTASRIEVGPEGSWPLRFDRLVQPVLDEHCVGCHKAGGDDPKAATFDLTGEHAYDHLVNNGTPSLAVHIMHRYRAGRSVAGGCAASNSALLSKLRSGHGDVRLDRDEMDRLITWMDTYAQRLGAFSPDQERRLLALKSRMAHMLIGP